MSVRELGSKVVSRLNVLLKPHGFRRQGATFFRDAASYSERFAISGSRWNSGQPPWEFSVEVGVFFSETPPRENAKGLWRHSHAVGSTSSILYDSPASFYVSASNIEAVSHQVAELILAVSSALPPLVAPARERAAKGLISFLPVPDSWLQNGVES